MGLGPWLTTIDLGVEMVPIEGAAAFGATSRFNMSTAVNGAL